MLDKFAQADELLRRGERDRALALYAEILQADPGDVRVLHRLGVLEGQRGDHPQALIYLARASALKPGDGLLLADLGLVQAVLGKPEAALFSYDEAAAARPDVAEIHCRRGDALLRLGRRAEAVTSYDRALGLDPGHAQALNNRGVALQGLGRLEEALASFEDALGRRPAFAEALNNRGNVLNDLKRLPEALASFDLAIQVQPGFSHAHNNRGNALRELGRLDEALASYDQALGFDAALVEALSNRGFVLWLLHRPAEALASYEQALALDPALPKALNLRGLALIALDRPEEALASYDAALALDPDFPDAWANKGMLLIELGRLDEARQASERAVELSPGAVRAHYILALSRRAEPGDPHLRALQDLAQGAEAMSADEQIHLRFALAKAFEDLGDHDCACAELTAGARLKRAHLDYDEAAILAGLERTRDAFSAGRLRENQGLGDPSAAPVIIVGMPRSGTTLVEQILASHPLVHATGETDHWAAALQGEASEGPQAMDQQLRRIGGRYLERIRASAPASAQRITNKAMESFHFVGLMHLALPNARFVHITRDPVDTCFSCYSKLFGDSLAYTYDLGELGRYYKAYARLMAHWREALPPGVMLEVAYEDVIADLEGQSRLILAHCALPWDDRVLDFHQSRRWIHTASASQVRQPIYTSSIGRWRPYKPWLGPLLDELAA